MKKNSFMKWMTSFFEVYLPEIRNCSPYTITAYKQSFLTFLEFMKERNGKDCYKITFNDFTMTNMDNYVLYMNNIKHYSASTINQRIAALSSFLKYSARRDISAIGALNNVMSINTPKVTQTEMSYFTKEEIGIILRTPSLDTAHGYRNRVILALMYDSGARAQEICNLNIEDIKFTHPTKVRLFGKGSKTREVPISPEVARLLKHYICGLKNTSKIEPLFISERGNRITTAGIKHITAQTVKSAKEANPELFEYDSYTPHSFRHTKAIHMLEAGVPLIYIRNFLGHESVQTTEIYAKVTQANMNRLLSEKKIDVSIPTEVKPEKNNNLPDFLK